MKSSDLSVFEKTAFNYNSSFQDKKKIAELRKEIELLKEDLKKERMLNNDDDIRVISTVEDFSQLIYERLTLNDKLNLVDLLNQDIKKQQGNIKPFKYFDKTDYVAKRIFKSKPAKKAALINAIKTMFEDGIEENEIEKIILELQNLNFIKMIDNKITYL